MTTEQDNARLEEEVLSPPAPPTITCVAPEQHDGLGVPQVARGRNLRSEFLVERVVVGTRAVEGCAWVLVYQLTNPENAEPSWEVLTYERGGTTYHAALRVHDDVTNVCMVGGVVYFGTRGNTVGRWHWREDVRHFFLLSEDCMPFTGTTQLVLAHNALFVGFAGLP